MIIDVCFAVKHINFFLPLQRTGMFGIIINRNIWVHHQDADAGCLTSFKKTFTNSIGFIPRPKWTYPRTTPSTRYDTSWSLPSPTNQDQDKSFHPGHKSDVPINISKMNHSIVTCARRSRGIWDGRGNYMRGTNKLLDNVHIQTCIFFARTYFPVV